MGKRAYTKPAKVTLAFLNLIGYLAVITVNALANLLPINNNTTGDLSDSYPNLFVPSGLTFSIWGVIYALLGVFAIYMIVAAFRESEAEGRLIEKVGILYFFTSLMNIAWIFAWHYEMVLLSLVFMVLLFLLLLSIYLRLGIGRQEELVSRKIMKFIPFSIYMGWITIAAIANVTAVSVYYNWRGWGISPQLWATIVIVVGIVIALGVMFTRNDIFYGLVVDWAILGILLKRLANPDVPAQSIIIICIIGLVLITISAIIIPSIKKKIY